jgi:cytochrome b561
MPRDPSAGFARYTAVAAALHWMIAFFILFNLITGSFMESLERPLKAVVVPLHASSGLTVLGLSVLRVIWRLTHTPPALDAALSSAERRAAHTVHCLLYFLMLAMPLTGWSIQSASARLAQNYYFFVVPVPKIGPIAERPPDDKATLHKKFVLLHESGAWIMVVLLAAHVAGALKHQFVDRRPQFARMWFGGVQGAGSGNRESTS